jgi:hypothetical protein
MCGRVERAAVRQHFPPGPPPSPSLHSRNGAICPQYAHPAPVGRPPAGFRAVGVAKIPLQCLKTGARFLLSANRIF